MTRSATTLPLAGARLRMVVAAAVLLALLGTLFNLPQRVAQAAARPDVVLFYLDDWAPYPKGLWSDPARTPELARFVTSGMEFRHATVSTPLCGPARAALLTGQYGHNNGVTKNDITPYDPRDSISPKLRARGYKTVFIGKHINLLDRVYRTRKEMGKLSSKWSQFDVIWYPQGQYYDWPQYRKSGTYQYGSEPKDHSSFVAAMRAVTHIRQTKKNKRLFMVISLYDGHSPLEPMARFKNHPSCSGIGGWAGPAYDEAWVADKPAYVRAQPRRSAPSYDLQERCEQMLTVDWVVGQVRKALVETGRAWNTLQVLTADNGFLMGDHRLTGKAHAYTTWVPLYMRWPSVIAPRRHVKLEPVSNVDLAPTFCHLAGCSVPQADGRSLVPIIKGKRKQLTRKFVYVEMLHNGANWGSGSPRARPAWSGVESTLGYDDKLWAYTRYRTGEEELYNLTNDPHRLSNLAGKPAHTRTLKDMRGFWRGVWNGDKVKWRSKLPIGIPPKYP